MQAIIERRSALALVAAGLAAAMARLGLPASALHSPGSHDANNFAAAGVPKDVMDRIVAAKDADGKKVIDGVKFAAKENAATKQMIVHYVEGGTAAQRAFVTDFVQGTIVINTATNATVTAIKS